MFWRYTEQGHPAAAGREGAEHRDAIQKLYQHNDALVGRVIDRLRDGDVLMVISDHGFSSFRRGVNLNAWLLREGYLALREGTRGDSEYLRDVDWSRTRAYAVGLAGLYLNLRGREAQGIVTPSQAELLKREIAVKLEGLQDPEGDRRMIAEAVDMARRYRGP